MSQELGRMARPSAEQYRTTRKLLFVPLILGPMGGQPDFAERVKRYWEQADAHISNLEARLGGVSKAYHELVPVGGEEGAREIEQLNQGSQRVVKSRMERGAELLALEDGEILAEFMDWSRCLSVGLQSQKVASKIFELYSEVQKKRNEQMAKRIEETLKAGEIGLLIMREGHRVQFPTDIQVFYVAPPALDEMRRWLREREAEAQRQVSQGPEGQQG